MTTTARHLRVGNLMTIDPVVISADAPASEAERLLKTHRVSGLPVVRGSATAGVISQTDLVVARSSGMISGNWERMLVRHLMTTPAVTVHAGTSLARAARLMVTRHIHRLVVVDDEDVPIGVVSSLDLLRSLLDDPDIGPTPEPPLRGSQVEALPSLARRGVAKVGVGDGDQGTGALAPAAPRTAPRRRTP